MQDERYSRQLLLPGFGSAAQQQLKAASVLVIGAGGLACPVLQYLAAAGVGTIGIADGDKIALSNLQRQVLYVTEDIGKDKAAVAASRLRQMNPDILIQEHSAFVDNKNALALFAPYDFIIDGTDNFTARYLINDVCVLLGKPLVFGAVYQYEGQVAIFNVADEAGQRINYRHLFPVPPGIQEAPDCGTAGVLGTLPGMIGMMQATEAIKLITGIGKPLINKMLTWNALNNESMTVDLSAAYQTITDGPQTEADYLAMNYGTFCNAGVEEMETVDAAAFQRFLADEQVAIIDVREYGELPLATFRHQQIPLPVLAQHYHEIERDIVVLFCQSGTRSLKAAVQLAIQFRGRKKVYQLQGGIQSL